MKTLRYYAGQIVRKGDVFNAPRWGTCVVVGFDPRDDSARAINTQTGERFDGLGQATFGESDRLHALPANPEHGTLDPVDLYARALLVLKLGKPDELDCLGGASWTVQTALGPLSVSIHPRDPGSVYLRFTDYQTAPWRDALRGASHLNPHSGKWNVHFSGGESDFQLAEVAAATALSRIRMADKRAAALNS